MATKLTYVIKGKGFSVEVKTLTEAKQISAETGAKYTPKYTPCKIDQRIVEGLQKCKPSFVYSRSRPAAAEKLQHISTQLVKRKNAQILKTVKFPETNSSQLQLIQVSYN